ncbi:MAG: hypothetical protein EBY41_00615 [Proteobacteria bacterium]|nr:hypothetical protein [Pseudomonadota bacterium]
MKDILIVSCARMGTSYLTHLIAQGTGRTSFFEDTLWPYWAIPNADVTQGRYLVDHPEVGNSKRKLPIEIFRDMPDNHILDSNIKEHKKLYDEMVNHKGPIVVKLFVRDIGQWGWTLDLIRKRDFKIILLYRNNMEEWLSSWILHSHNHVISGDMHNSIYQASNMILTRAFTIFASMQSWSEIADYVLRYEDFSGTPFDLRLIDEFNAPGPLVIPNNSLGNQERKINQIGKQKWDRLSGFILNGFKKGGFETLKLDEGICLKKS